MPVQKWVYVEHGLAVGTYILRDLAMPVEGLRNPSTEGRLACSASQGCGARNLRDTIPVKQEDKVLEALQAEVCAVGKGGDDVAEGFSGAIVGG
jgi:hypothetical protein